MKAEHRKELETNTLADRVGDAMQRVKGSSRRSVLLYFIAAAVLIVAVWLGMRWYSVSKQETSMRWALFDDGARGNLEQLAQMENSKAGRAARFQIAWLFYWDMGVRMIGIDPAGSMNRLGEAGKLYAQLAEECKDDPIFEPQALLGIAVVEETRSVQDTARLARAKESYQVVVDKYGGEKESAEAKFAQKRLEILNNKGKLKELENVYVELQQLLKVPGAQQLPPNFVHPDFPMLKGKAEKAEKSK
ncbi:MAG TPA: hypothetical protein VFE62_04875 [Gemmataceae bacterium]|nr:hypothetical protein [Gemmataceae bacterium]